jgi:hypothetical protein
MENDVFEGGYQLKEFTAVTLKSGKVMYIKEFFTQAEVESKQELDVTGVYLVLPPRLNLNEMAVFEDEKKKISVPDIQSMKRITLT